MKKKKIAFLIPNVFSLGGEQRVTSVIASMLAEQKKYEVSIICTDKNIKQDYKMYNLSNKVKIIDGYCKDGIIRYFLYINMLVKFINKKTNLIKKFTRLLEFSYFKAYYEKNKKIINIINDENFDYVIGVAGYYSMLLAIYRNKINKKTKIIGWQHSCFNAYFNKKGMYYWNRENIFLKNLKKLDKYIVLTNDDKKNIDKFFKINSIVINNPRSFVTEQKSSVEIKEFISAGRFVEPKGYELLIESFNIFSKSNIDWKLRIYGDGPLKEKYANLIKKYCLEDRVILENYTSNISEKLLNSSIYLLSSKWEGFAMILLEALEAGLPVISYRLPCTIETISNGENGFIVDNFDAKEYANKMLILANNYDLRKKMSKNSKIKSENYSEEVIIKKWYKILN